MHNHTQQEQYPYTLKASYPKSTSYIRRLQNNYIGNQFTCAQEYMCDAFYGRGASAFRTFSEVGHSRSSIPPPKTDFG